MHRKLFFLFALFVGSGIIGCNRAEEAAPESPPAAAEAAKEVGESCSVDCGKGVVAAIQCAEGEKPVCDCKATPNASCVTVPAGATGAK